MQIEARSFPSTMVTVRWINGHEEVIGECEKIREVRAKVCACHGALWPYVSLFTPEFNIIIDDEAEPLPLIVVIIRSDTVHTEAEWINAAMMHAIHNDGANLIRMKDHLEDENGNHLRIFETMWQRYWTRKPQGHSSVVRAMRSIRLDINVPIRERQNTTALHLAADHGSPEVVATLLESNALVDVQSGPQRETALQAAVQCGKTPIVITLLEWKAKVNVKNAIGETALHKAAANGNLKIVEKLICAGGDVNVKSKNCFVALHHALYNGFFPVVKALIDAGALIDCRAKQIASGKDVDVHSFQGKSKTARLTLRWASDGRHKKIAEFLESRALANPSCVSKAEKLCAPVPHVEVAHITRVARPTTTAPRFVLHHGARAAQQHRRHWQPRPMRFVPGWEQMWDPAARPNRQQGQAGGDL